MLPLYTLPLVYIQYCYRRRMVAIPFVTTWSSSPLTTFGGPPLVQHASFVRKHLFLPTPGCRPFPSPFDLLSLSSSSNVSPPSLITSVNPPFPISDRIVVLLADVDRDTHPTA